MFSNFRPRLEGIRDWIGLRSQIFFLFRSAFNFLLYLNSADYINERCIHSETRFKQLPRNNFEPAPTCVCERKLVPTGQESTSKIRSQIFIYKTFQIALTSKFWNNLYPQSSFLIRYLHVGGLKST